MKTKVSIEKEELTSIMNKCDKKALTEPMCKKQAEKIAYLLGIKTMCAYLLKETDNPFLELPIYN